MLLLWKNETDSPPLQTTDWLIASSFVKGIVTSHNENEKKNRNDITSCFLACSWTSVLNVTWCKFSTLLFEVGWFGLGHCTFVIFTLVIGPKLQSVDPILSWLSAWLIWLSGNGKALALGVVQWQIHLKKKQKVVQIEFSNFVLLLVASASYSYD